jgi:hypothetical protein
MGTIRLFVPVLVLVGAVSPSAPAGWVTIKNETDKVVVIQETSTVNGKHVRGKAYKLAPGEVLKEFHTQVGEKNLLVSELDAATPVKVRLTWGKDDAAFRVTRDGDEVKVAVKTK